MSDHRKLLVDAGALVHGHFVYQSFRHGEWYVNKTAGLVLASHVKQHANAIARHFAGYGIQAVVGPELGAIKLMGVVTDCLYQLGDGDDVAGIMAEKVRDKDGKPTGAIAVVRDQQRFLKRLKTLVVEDVLTTGDSAKRAVDEARAVGAEVVAVGALWNRGAVTAEMLGVPELFCLVDEEIKSFPPGECLSCKAGIPVNTNLGKGKEFLEKQAFAK